MPTGPARYEVRFVAGGPEPLDGRGDHAPWPQIDSLSALSLLGRPEQRAPCRTTIKACFDRRYLYLYYHCVDEAIVCTYTQRDQPLWQQDVVEAFICPHGDVRRYFEFNFSPRGVVFDARISNPHVKRDASFSFDAGWDAAGLRVASAGRGRLFGNSRVDQWWSVEAAIPFEDLQSPTPADGQQWRVNLFRIDYGGDGPVFCTWSPIADAGPGFHQGDCFGTFVFRR